MGNQEAEPRKENVKQITKDDIRDVLKVAGVLEKAIVLVGVSSGLAEADIMNLKVRDFNDGRDDETGITTLKLTRVKTGIKFVTFLTPEVSNAVLDYLAFRNRTPQRDMNPVRREQLEKQRVTRDDGYLFVLRNISDAYLDKKKKKDEEHKEKHEEWLKRYNDMLVNETDEQWHAREELRRFDDDSFTKLYSRLSEKCGKCNPRGWNTIRSHNMRKYFNSALINAGFDFFFVDHMLGHKADAVDRAYYWHDAEKLKERYKFCVPHLAIEPALDTVSSPEYLRLLKENETLKSDALTIDQHIEDLVKAAEERIANHYTRIGYDPTYREKYVRDVDWEDKKGQKRHISFIRKPEEDENV
ncbi:MAG TPA: tyrosine-type recombinase/integrase [Bacteroidales bacterium]|nr:tyrosine-type recombinase/integrase [Bacteroidales bacterium]